MAYNLVNVLLPGTASRPSFKVATYSSFSSNLSMHLPCLYKHLPSYTFLYSYIKIFQSFSRFLNFISANATVKSNYRILIVGLCQIGAEFCKCNLIIFRFKCSFTFVNQLCRISILRKEISSCTTKCKR